MPKCFYQFTNEQLLEANSVDLELFLPSHGEQLKRDGRNKRLVSDHSISVRGNAWYDFSKDRGGLAISFMKEFFGLSFVDSVKALLGNTRFDYEHSSEPKEEKAFSLPRANSDMRRTFAYLVQTRCIAQTVVAEFAHQKMIYETADKHEAVFVGFDKDGTAQHAHCRSTNSNGKAFRQNASGSDASYSFHFIGRNEKLYVFESPIDMLSYITLVGSEWKENSYVALCGVSGSAMLKTLDDYSQLTDVVFCLDNDLAGITATQRLKRACEELGYSTSVDAPSRKDWNEDLCATVSEQLEMKQVAR